MDVKLFEFQAPPTQSSRSKVAKSSEDRRLAWPKIHQNYEAWDALIGWNTKRAFAQVMMSSARLKDANVINPHVIHTPM